MSSDKRVDVLSVLQDCICYLSQKDDLAGYEVKQMEDTHAAVAELIEASQIALNYLIENGCSRERLAAALANIGPTP